MSIYNNFIDRNIGILSQNQQGIIKNTCVAIFGIGGLGGVISEILCRSGIGYLKIIDPDKFELSNLNRHVFAFQSTIGKKKIDVAEKFLCDINPEIKIDKYLSWDEKNIAEILDKTDCAILAVDKVKECIIISRCAYKLNIPLVEGWAIPFGNVRVYAKDTPTLEDVYDLPSKNKNLEGLDETEIKKMDLKMLLSLTNIDGVRSHYDETAQNKIIDGFIPSFAPYVWFTAVIMSLEVIKIILKWDTIAYAPRWSLYDPILSRIPRCNYNV